MRFPRACMAARIYKHVTNTIVYHRLVVPVCHLFNNEIPQSYHRLRINRRSVKLCEQLESHRFLFSFGNGEICNSLDLAMAAALAAKT